MGCAICDWSPDNSDYRFLDEGDHWRVVLAPNQSLVGRCVIHLKRHSDDLANLSRDELLEWLEIVKMLEAGLRFALGATMFNWSCQMNHAYRESPPDPHVHWWMVPRYRHPGRIRGWTLVDPHFGNPYDHARWSEVPPDIHQEIAERVKAALPQ